MRNIATENAFTQIKRQFSLCVVAFIFPFSAHAILPAHAPAGRNANVPQQPDGYIVIVDPKASPWGISFVKPINYLVVTAIGDSSLGGTSGQIWEANPNSDNFERAVISSDEGQEYPSLHEHVYDEQSDRLFVCSDGIIGVPGHNPSSDIKPSVVVFQLSTNGTFVWVKAMNFINKPNQRCGGLEIVNKVLFVINRYATDISYPAIYYADISSNELPANLTTVQTYGDLGYSSEETTEKNDLITSIRAKRKHDDNLWPVYLLDSKHNRIMDISFQRDDEHSPLKRCADIKNLPLPFEVKVPINFYNYDDSNFFVAADIVEIYLVGYDAAMSPTISWQARSPSLVTGLTVVTDSNEGGEAPNSSTLFTVSPVLVDNEYRVSKFSFPVPSTKKNNRPVRTK